MGELNPSRSQLLSTECSVRALRRAESEYPRGTSFQYLEYFWRRDLSPFKRLGWPAACCLRRDENQRAQNYELPFPRTRL